MSAKSPDEFMPRRMRLDLMTEAEKAIHDAKQAVEKAGAHPLLTEAIILLGDAQDAVADFVELPTKPPTPATVQPKEDAKQYANLLASMCYDFMNGGISEETFKANLHEINASL